MEGQIHRLKLVKRQMYGRAKFNLLCRRVLPYVPASVSLSPSAPHDVHGNCGRTQIELTTHMSALVESSRAWAGHVSIVTADGIQMLAARER